IELEVDQETSTMIRRLKIQPGLVSGSSSGVSIDNHATGTHTSPHASPTESNTQYGRYMVGSPTQCPAWQPRRGGGGMAGVGLVLTLGSPAHRRSRRRISRLAGAHNRTGLGLGHPVTWLGESCMAYHHNGSDPFDHH